MASARSRTRSTSVSAVALASMWSRRRSAAWRSSSRSTAESMPSFCAASAANWSRASFSGMRRMWRQQEVHGLQLLLRAGAGKRLPGALDQVIGLPARAAQRRRVGLHAALADVAVGVETAVEGDDLDVEALFGEQGNGLFGGIGAGGVGIEVDHHLRGVALENRHLLLGKGRSAGGDHVLNAAQKDRDAVHLALDQQRKLHLANRGLRLVQVEEDVALGVERRLRRVDVLGAGLVARLQGARGEGDHAAALVARWER